MRPIAGCLNALLILGLLAATVMGLVMILDGGWGIPLGIAAVLAAATAFWRRFAAPDEGWTDDGERHP